MALDPQAAEEVAKSPWLTGALGAVVALRGVPGTTWLERLLNVLSGSLLSGFLSPALSEYFGMSTQAMQSAMSFAVGLFGLNLMAAVLLFIKTAKIEDYIPWGRKSDQRGGDQ